MLERKGDSGDAAGEIGDLRVVTMGPSQVVTAVRTEFGRLKLIAWSLATVQTLEARAVASPFSFHLAEPLLTRAGEEREAVDDFAAPPPERQRTRK